MKCKPCSTNFKEHTGSLSLHDPSIGDYAINKITYGKCEDCGELFFGPGAMKLIEAKERETPEGLIRERPIAEFVSAARAADILGISRQAIHKHRRIRRGFVCSLKFGGKRVYHKKSLELFKKNGDGRFPWVETRPVEKIKYLSASFAESTVPKIPLDYTGKHTAFNKDQFFNGEQLWTQGKRTTKSRPYLN